MLSARLSVLFRTMLCKSYVFECNFQDCQEMFEIFKDFRDHLKNEHSIKNKKIIKEMADKRYILDKREQVKKQKKEIQLVNLVEDEREPEQDSWLTRVQYKCLVCDAILSGLDIKTHMSSLHNYKTRSQFKAITQDKYTCKICQCNFSFLDLRAHFWRKHRLKLEEYAKQYEDLEEDKLVIEEKETTEEEQERLEEKEKGEEEKENKEEEVGEEREEKCVEVKKITKNISGEINLSRKRRKTEEEGPSELKPEQNKGKDFICRLCGKSFFTSLYLERHASNWHKEKAGKTAKAKGQSRYCCPFTPCSFSMTREEIKKSFSQAVNHVKILHSEESFNREKINWIKKRIV